MPSLDIDRNHTIVFDIESISRRRMAKLNNKCLELHKLEAGFYNKNYFYDVHFCLYGGENIEHSMAVLQNPRCWHI